MHHGLKSFEDMITKKVRFSVSLDSDVNQQLLQWGGRLRPRMSKQYLVELAVERLLEQLASRQLLLPLAPNKDDDGPAS